MTAPAPLDQEDADVRPVGRAAPVEVVFGPTPVAEKLAQIRRVDHEVPVEVRATEDAAGLGGVDVRGETAGDERGGHADAESYQASRDGRHVMFLGGADD